MFQNVGHLYHICSNLDSSLRDRTLTHVFGWHCELCSHTVTFGSIPEARIMPVFNRAPTESPEITGIEFRVLALALTHKDFSRFSESSDVVMT